MAKLQRNNIDVSQLVDWTANHCRHEVAQWLRCCGTIRKVAGSISTVVSEFFIDINPSDLTNTLGSTQPLTEMSTRCISCG